MRSKKRIIGILIVVIIVLGCLSCSLLLYRCNTTKNYPNNIKVGELYQPNLENVKYDESSGISYMDNIVIVTFNKDVDDGRKNEIVNQINGKLVGKIDNDIWEIEITSRNLNELKRLIKELQDMEDVFYAFYDSVNSLSSKTNGYVTPNDPWKKGEDWLKQGSSGSNWGLESIQVPYAWNYKGKFNKIQIGIVDNGFDTKHEDLTIQFANHENEKLNNRADHGTQVAGIIGAIENNEKGITGIVWNKELICYDAMPEWYQDKKKFKSSELKNLSSVSMAGIIECVKSGAKVTNFSIGLKDVPDCSNGKINLDESQINYSAELASFTIAYLRTYYPDKDFIVVQASGNGDKKGFGVDAKNNGYFCSITSKNYFNKSEISLNEILDRIIVVGAVEKDGDKYKITKFSNCGSSVDIVAPGKNIYSTCSSSLISAQGLIPYKYDEGTSFSAPMVTSVASLVWSINESFSPSEVKEIVCNNYADWVRLNSESVYTTSPFADKNGYLGYPMVNAKLAVEEAIRRTDTLVVPIEDETQSTEPVEIEEIETTEPTTTAKTEQTTTTTEPISTIPEYASIYNGHSYMVYPESMTWKEAKEYCENLGGHLVTISDAQEQKYIEDLAEKYVEKTSYWLGGYYENSMWKWVDNTLFSYTNWDSWNNGIEEYKQPDNHTGDEFYLRFANKKMQYSTWYSNKGKWNDVSNEADGSSGDVPINSFGLICEWDSVERYDKAEYKTEEANPEDTIRKMERALNKLDMKELIECYEPQVQKMYNEIFKFDENLMGMDIGSLLDGFTNIYGNEFGLEMPEITINIDNQEYISSEQVKMRLTIHYQNSTISDEVIDINLIQIDDIWYISSEMSLW